MTGKCSAPASNAPNKMPKNNTNNRQKRRVNIVESGRCSTKTTYGVLKPFKPAKPKPAEAGSDSSGLEELYAELKDLEMNGEQEDDDEEGFVDILNEMSEERGKNGMITYSL